MAGVGVGGGVGVGEGVGVQEAHGVGVGVGVPSGCAQYLPPLCRVIKADGPGVDGTDPGVGIPSS